MQAAITLTHGSIRILGLAVTVLGVDLLTTQNVKLVPVYTTVAVALMLALWTLAFLGARAGVHPGLVALTVVVATAAPILSLTGEGTLYVLAGVSALGESENLAPRIRSLTSNRRQRAPVE
jgi:hypothetical protein